MISSSPTAMMEAVYEIAVYEFGAKWVEQHEDAEALAIHLGGGRYSLIVRAPLDGCVLITNTIDCPDPNLPGLGDALLREHSCWIVGRIQRVDDALMVAHTVLHSDIEEGFASAVRSVHAMAGGVESFLRAAFDVDGEDDGDSD
jgi:hypothetical protein